MENAPKQTPSGASSFFSQLSPKAAFVFGAVAATAALSVIALIIVLPLALGKGDTKKSTTTRTNTNSTAAASNTNTGVTAVSFRPVTDDDHIRGDKDAPVTIIEYSDYECPFCKRHHPIMQQLLEEYDGQIRWVYRQFPIEQLHSQAPRESVASECAGEQGKFWEWTDLIYEVTNSNDSLDLTKLPDYADQVGLDVDQFNECLDSGKYDERIAADIQDAANAGARGTPHSLIVDAEGNATPVSGALPIAQFRTAIDAALNS